MADKYEAQVKASCNLLSAFTGKQNINMVFTNLFTYLSTSLSICAINVYIAYYYVL